MTADASYDSAKFKALIEEQQSPITVVLENASDNPSTGSKKVWQLYTRRWGILASFFFINLLQCISWMCVSVLAI